ncbi:MAG: radical SAM protein [Halobacteriaceae archaeon]
MVDPESLSVVVVDGYVDEPAHFGVPPYISTYPRYTAGGLIDAGVPREQITYLTIDAIRDDMTNWQTVEDADLMIYIGGMTVPGNYVGGTPAEPDEVRQLAWTTNGTTLMGGPVRFGVGDKNEGATETERKDLDYDFIAKGDIEAAAHDLVANDLEGFQDRMRDIDEVTRWARDGAFIVENHPNHPDYLIAEMETSRGCPYRCSFCTEPLYGNPTFRPPESVLSEVEALGNHGIRHFRLGRQADILAYGGDGEKPNPEALETLYSGIRERVPNLGTLHLDNMNPITVVKWPEKARKGIRTIAKYNTPGDTAAFGLESADPVVQEQNNLNVSAEECFKAVKIVNEEGGWRPEEDNEYDSSTNTYRLPKLLPGINLVHGLQGERKETFEHNLDFLNRVYDEGLMLRRINIRQVMAFEGTDMSETGAEIAHDHKKLFKQYKQQVRETIDNPMLQRVAPAGTVLPDVHLEYHEDGKTFGRQLGTYPLLVGIPGERSLETTMDVILVDHGYRSVTGIPYPLDLNSATLEELTAIPGLGKSRAGDIVSNRPYTNLTELDIGIDLQQYITVQPPEKAY